MVLNEGIITTFGTTGTLGWLDDGTDKMHSGLIKALWQTATGSRVVSSGTLTQSGARFTLATPVVYRTEGSKITLAGNNYVDIDNGGANDRYDLIYIDADSDALAVEKGNDTLTTPQVKDINKDDVPVAIVKVTSGSTAASTTYEFQVLMSTFDKDVLNDNEVATAKIADDAVTYAKIQNVVNDERLLGRVSGANGIIEELTQSQVMTFLGNPLTAESDTLDTVTGRGATTANSISVGTITSTVNQNISYEVVEAASQPVITGTKTVAYIHDMAALGNTVALPVPASGNILYIKNIFTTPLTITSTPPAVINLGDTTHPKITSANVITLAPFEHVTLQSVNDATAPLVTGHMIISD